MHEIVLPTSNLVEIIIVTVVPNANGWAIILKGLLMTNVKLTSK